MKGLDCIYQDQLAMRPLIEYLESLCDDGEKVIWRDAFRWKDKDGVLSNHYESASIYSLAEDFDYQILVNFNHVAIVKRK